MSLTKDLAGVVPGELDNTSPEIIWLQIDTSASNDDRDELWPGDDGVTWCSESIGGLEVQYVRADIYHTHHAEIAKNSRDIETLKDALFQISARLNAPREPDMDDMSWHTDMIARAQYLANQDRRLRALEMALDELGAGSGWPDHVWVRKRAAEIMREEGE